MELDSLSARYYKYYARDIERSIWASGRDLSS